jgi:hypothetical protein
MGRLHTLKPRVATLDTRRAQSPAATERIRGSALQTIRERILRRDCGICRCPQCVATGALRPAREVDHSVPLWAGGAEADANRLSISEGCHQAKNACEARMRAMGGYDASLCTCGRHPARA